MRTPPFAEDNFYHVYVHSVGDMLLFRNENEYERFMLTAFLANSGAPLPRLDRSVDPNLVWVRNGQPLVKIINFCLMPTHIHFLLGETGNGNISRYMHRLLVSHSKYVNKKYERRGHVFESSFNSIHVDTNEYLLRVSAYIHLNPRKTEKWQRVEHQYPWSSYQDYAVGNRWGDLLATDVILSQFDTVEEYTRFVESTRPETTVDDEPMLT